MGIRRRVAFARHQLLPSSSAPRARLFSMVCMSSLQQSHSKTEVDAVISDAEALLSQICSGGFSAEEDAMVVTEAVPPYSIVHVNDAWCRLCKYSRLEADHNTCAIMLQGPQTNICVLKAMMERVRRGEVVGAYLDNFKADGSHFTNKIQIVRVPPASDEEPAYFAAKLQEIDMSGVLARLKKAIELLKRSGPGREMTMLSDRE